MQPEAITIGGQPITYEINKDLEPGKWVKIGDWQDADKAKIPVSEAIDRETRKSQS